MFSFTFVIVSIWTALLVFSTKAVPHAHDNSRHADFALRRGVLLSAQLYEIWLNEEGNTDAAQAFQKRLTSVSSKIDILSAIGNNTDSSQRASIACNISKLLFPKFVITEDPRYTEEREVNWCYILSVLSKTTLLT